MRITLILVAIVISGCATPQQRAQAMLAEFGPVCETLGFKTGTQEYGQCVLQSATADQQRRATVYQAIMAQPKPAPIPAPVTCRPVGSAVSCF